MVVVVMVVVVAVVVALVEVMVCLQAAPHSTCCVSSML